jgi:Cu-Zn family superoxide dismutase
MKQIQIIGGVLAALGLAAFSGCATGSGSSESNSSSTQLSKPRQTAIAVLSPGANGQVRGTVTFAEETEGVRVIASVEGLTPGPHGFHIHEKGDCSAPDFSSAGGHFNPLGRPHGSPTDPEHHSGDFGNIEANQQGVARYERVFAWLSFKGTNSILGRAVIVHEKPDDLKSQPSGNAGARLACGVIQSTR